MSGIKRLLSWSKKYLWLVVLIVVLCTVLQWLYAYLPLFIQYAFERLGYGTDKTDLPKFLLNIYD